MSLPFFLLFFISPCFSSFIAPITKHYHQTPPFYTLQLYLQTPLQPTHLLLHLNAPFTAIDCTRNYNSTNSRPVPCNSSLCRSLQSNNLNTSSSCINIPTTIWNNKVPNTCVLLPHNSFALIDSLGLHTTNGYNLGRVNLFPEFILTCSNEASKLLHGSSNKEITGLAGLGFSKYSLPAQVSTTSSVFAICLSGSPSAPGIAFFNFEKPYYFLPGIDASEHLNYTPIITSELANTNSLEEYAYFVGVKSININEKPITLTNKTFVTRISTIDPYTVLERSIFTALIETFTNESIEMKLEPIDKPVKPFSVCYEADEVAETYLGPNVPKIEVVMENDVIWSVFGKNSMVRIIEEEGLDVWCLGIVDGGVGSSSSIVIGGNQLEDNLLQFDLGTKRLGFSSSLMQHKTMCANFNFSTINMF
ncbi:probable aspartic proteinase GIP1 [Rutidosis leptorrhynchoides]|uniref:probable aspartic proteinase GIP1 n=1 Tax=Rutidosis leptorrhynchoides TaxID=125765 RepID=UPI003A9A4C3C